jgi:hypothetical protein
MHVFWWLATGALGPDTSQREWIGATFILAFAANAVRAFYRVAKGAEAYFGPTVSFHDELPERQRTLLLLVLAVGAVTLPFAYNSFP